MSNKSDGQQERRKYKRIKKNFLLSYYELSYPDVKYEASQLKNIGKGGMCLITSKSFASSSLLGIELKTPFLAEKVHLEGKVEKSHEKVKDIIYETRLSFSNLSSQAEFVLDKLVQYFENESNNE